MLVAGINDGEGHIQALADYLSKLCPSTAYISIPTRPPAEDWVRAPDEGTLNRAYQLIDQQVEQVELLIGYEGDAFAFTGNVEEDLLSITAVHPMREEAVRKFLARANADWSTVDRLVAEGQLIQLEYEGHKFYLRKISKARS